MPLDLEVAQARLALNEAQKAARVFKSEIDMWVAEASKKIRDEHQAHLTNLNRLEWEAKVALEAAIEKQATSQPHEFEGKKMVRSTYVRGRYLSRLVETPIYGIFETVTSKSVFAANTPSWRKPDVGSHIVRLIKKDGQPGIKWEVFNERSDWVVAP